jgi:hypothetical protein
MSNIEADFGSILFFHRSNPQIGNSFHITFENLFKSSSLSVFFIDSSSINNLDHHINSMESESQLSGKILNVFNKSEIVLFSIHFSPAFSLTIFHINFKSSNNLFFVNHSSFFWVVSREFQASSSLLD